MPASEQLETIGKSAAKGPRGQRKQKGSMGSNLRLLDKQSAEDYHEKFPAWRDMALDGQGEGEEDGLSDGSADGEAAEEESQQAEGGSSSDGE